MSDNPIKELDVVALITEVAGLPRGSVGTVVMVYEPSAFEVEFVDGEGHTYGLTTVREDQLLRLNFEPAVAA